MGDPKVLGAGRELDALIAERVMGWTELAPRKIPMPGSRLYGDEWFGRKPGGKRFAPPPRYSTDIAAAWHVVETWRERGECFQIDSLGFDGENWRIWFMDASDGKMDRWPAEAATAPLAICRAALVATGDPAHVR